MNEFRTVDNISAFLGFEESSMGRLMQNWDNIMSNVDKRWIEADQEVRGIFGVDQAVDEMALYFPDEEFLIYFIKRAVRDGWVLFNQDEDQVTTTPISSIYGVQYWFLRKEGKPYRLELMRVLDGFSPYHGSLQEACEEANFPVLLAHASFKMTSESMFGAALVAMRNAGFELMQHCVSSYGRFSYLIDVDRKSKLVALKPRLNVRDAEDTRGSDAERGEF